MLHARHTNADHAEVSRFALWVQVAGVLAAVLAERVVRLCRRG